MVLEIDSRPGCVAVVTGGARGIGVEVVKTLAECNISVIIGKICFLKLPYINSPRALRNFWVRA